MKYLVAVNLPKYFSHFHTDEILFDAGIALTLSDNGIWEFAKANQLTIINKDAAFYPKTFLTEKKPKVIPLKLGNQKLNDLHSYFNKNWAQIHFIFHNTILSLHIQIALK